MAVNVTSAARPDPVQHNLRETRAARTEQRSQQATDARRTEQNDRAENGDVQIRQRVKQNTEASRNEARGNDDAAAAQRRDAQQADKKADTQRRQNEKTLGRHIDTTA